MSTVIKIGFDLLPTKLEGKTFSFDYPDITSWDGCGEEFEQFFNNNYSRWYFRFLKKHLLKAWDSAILTYLEKQQSYESNFSQS